MPDSQSTPANKTEATPPSNTEETLGQSAATQPKPVFPALPGRRPTRNQGKIQGC